jgi:hypothetical protein
MKKTIILVALAMALPAISTLAQNKRPQRGGPPVVGGGAESGAQGGQNNKPGRPQGGPGHDGQRPPTPPLISALDANHDGTIDATEIANASAALKTLDKNNDGSLTAEEVRPPMPSHRPGGSDAGQNRPQGDRKPPQSGQDRPQGDHQGPVPPVIGALDANGDKTIDAAEIANASAALLKLDKNGDGKLAIEEIRPQRPPKGPQSKQ